MDLERKEVTEARRHIKPLFTKADVLQDLANNTRAWLDKLELVKVIEQSANLHPEMAGEALKEIAQVFPELDLQIKAHTEALAELNELATQEKILQAKFGG